MAAVRPRARSSSVITSRAWTKKAHTRTPATSAPVPTLTSTTLLRRLSRRTRATTVGPERTGTPGSVGVPGLLISGLGRLPLLDTGAREVQSANHMKMYLAGQWAEKDQRTEVVNPFDGKAFDTVPRADANDLEKALQSALRGARAME